MNIKDYKLGDLGELSKEIREIILQTVAKNGGHLSSTLGAVDLIVAMHYVFDVEKDPFIFDVSHQAYAHKLLTDRKEKFSTLREFGGISGYTRPNESKYDYFSAGHSSTSISVAVGAAKAIKLKNENRIPVVMIGDGSLTAGMAYEALNELGAKKYPVVIILNDNEMSIGKPIGAISNYLTKLKVGKVYQGMKDGVRKFLDYLPKDATLVAKKFDEMFAMNGIWFEEMGFEYVGPIDGHNIKELISIFKRAKELNKPVIIHAKTLKGKGYKEAEGYYEHWHGVGAFDIETGEAKTKSSLNATKVFSKKLLEMAKKYENITGVTAAMPSGTGMKELLKEFPNRFWDVAIAEQHAVTSMAAMAKEGFKPFIAIYSTFLQRGFDQIVHDVCIDSYPVVFAIDRAGIVGQDGETHQGVFDIGYLRILPNMIIFAPRDFNSLEKAMEFAYNIKDKPTAFRYPRGAFLDTGEYPSKDFELGKSELLEEGNNIMLIGYGNGVGRANKVRKELSKEGITTGLLDLRFIKPIDKKLLKEIAQDYKKWFVFSDNALLGGVGEVLQSFVNENNLNIEIKSFELEDKFIPHGATEDIEKYLKIDTKSLIQKVKEEI